MTAPAAGEEELFSSRLGLILTTIGAAVGTGNIWRFPREAAANGVLAGYPVTDIKIVLTDFNLFLIFFALLCLMPVPTNYCW